MRRHSVFLSVLLATLLLAVPAQSQAFFGFFGGGFNFGFGGGWGGGWGGPGWWGSNYWGGPGYWGGTGYNWYRPNYLHRPYAWQYYRPFGWTQPYYGLTLPYAYAPPVMVPAVQAPVSAQEK